MKICCWSSAHWFITYCQLIFPLFLLSSTDNILTSFLLTFLSWKISSVYPILAQLLRKKIILFLSSISFYWVKATTETDDASQTYCLIKREYSHCTTIITTTATIITIINKTNCNYHQRRKYHFFCFLLFFCYRLRLNYCHQLFRSRLQRRRRQPTQFDVSHTFSLSSLVPARPATPLRRLMSSCRRPCN